MTRPQYSAVMLAHYREPRNVGRLDPSSPHVGTGIAGSVAEQGALVRIQVRLAPSGRIDEARFKAYGCGATIAAASWAGEWLKGKTLDQAQSLHASEIMQALSLPASKMHCAILVEDAVRAALSHCRSKQE